MNTKSFLFPLALSTLIYFPFHMFPPKSPKISHFPPFQDQEASLSAKRAVELTSSSNLGENGDLASRNTLLSRALCTLAITEHLGGNYGTGKSHFYSLFCIPKISSKFTLSFPAILPSIHILVLFQVHICFFTPLFPQLLFCQFPFVMLLFVIGLITSSK